MNLRKMRHRLQKSLAEKGLLPTASAVIRKAFRRGPKSADEPKRYLPVHPFDQKHGVETSGLLHPEDLASGKKQDLFNAGYFGVAPSALRQILEHLALDFAQFTFVDLGSGKGRALLIASEYPFRAIIGVELSPQLHSIAEANIARYTGSAHACRDIRVIEGDATDFAFPPGPLVVYLWNPFELPVFTRVLTKLEASLIRDPRDIYILYIQPDLEHLLQAGGHWRRLWSEEFQLSEEDYAAHAFPARAEVCSAYVPSEHLRRHRRQSGKV